MGIIDLAENVVLPSAHPFTTYNQILHKVLL